MYIKLQQEVLVHWTYERLC